MSEAREEPDIRSIRIPGVGYDEYRRGTVGYHLLGLVEASQQPAPADVRDLDDIIEKYLETRLFRDANIPEVNQLLREFKAEVIAVFDVRRKP